MSGIRQVVTVDKGYQKRMGGSREGVTVENGRQSSRDRDGSRDSKGITIEYGWQ